MPRNRTILVCLATLIMALASGCGTRSASKPAPSATAANPIVDRGDGHLSCQNSLHQTWHSWGSQFEGFGYKLEVGNREDKKIHVKLHSEGRPAYGLILPGEPDTALRIDNPKRDQELNLDASHTQGALVVACLGEDTTPASTSAPFSGDPIVDLGNGKLGCRAPLHQVSHSWESGGFQYTGFGYELWGHPTDKGKVWVENRTIYRPVYALILPGSPYKVIRIPDPATRIVQDYEFDTTTDTDRVIACVGENPNERR